MGDTSMASDPSRHLRAPMASLGAAAVDSQAQPAAPPVVMFRTRAVNFLGRRIPIVYQKDNGPCPLLAICNVLLLNNVISLNPEDSEVSQQRLLSLVADVLVNSNIAIKDKADEYVRNKEQNIANVIDLLPCLMTGMDVNVMFRKIHDFESTRERAIFDLLDIQLCHGWIVDPQDTDTAAAIGSKSYNALASGLAEFKSGKSTDENKHMEEEAVDFAAATTAALKIPSPSISRGISFDEDTLSGSAEPHMRRGDREEEEELMRVLNLSKAETVDAVDGSICFDTSNSHLSSNMEETPQSESFLSEAQESEVVGETKKEGHGNHAMSDGGSLLPVTNGAVNCSEVVPRESKEFFTSKEQEVTGTKNMLPGDLDIPVQSSESTPACQSHESFAPSDHQLAAPFLIEDDKETCRQHSDVQIHGQPTDIEVTSGPSVAACEAAPDHATIKLDDQSDSIDNSEPLPASIQECEPIYQGEVHILGSTNVSYENQEPVYEGEVVLAEQANKTGEASSCLEDNATEHEWELIDNFLQTTANQLTVYGLFCLQEGLNERELCVFFRNNHFNTMFKYKGSLYLLATDEGFISQTDLVWQKLDEVNGDGVFLTSNFTPFKAETPRNPRNDSWNEQKAMTSTADYIAQFDNSNSYVDQGFVSQSDLALQKLDEVNRDEILHTLSPFGGSENKTLSLPGKLYRILQPHQKQGLDWLWAQHCGDSPGGVVTDDMGLGKTLQTTIFLSGLFYSTIIESAIIIAPLSILDAWVYELSRSGLSRRVQQYNVSGEKSLQIIEEQGGVLLISYTMYSKNYEKLIGFPKGKWDYVILDEAHKIKNFDAGITQSIKKIRSRKKLLLTGTPITRNLMDIYSLMDFIKKDFLGEKSTFRKNYACPVELGQYVNSSEDEKERCLQALARIRKKISPYMLRRTKSLLIESGHLPCKKHDVILWMKLSDIQVHLCRTFCKLYGSISQSWHQADKHSLTETMVFQLICNDPALLLHIRDNEKHGTEIRKLATKLLKSADINDALCKDIDSSSKLSFILDLIKELFEQERLDRELFEKKKQQDGKEWEKLKILIFSQFISMLDRIEEVLKLIIQECDIIRIDGSVGREERDALIKDFKSKTSGPVIFLLSARVGGEGLTLTTATRVIIVDPSWNLSDDNQIADRVYRIGQKKDVVIYRLFTCGTVEEHAYKLQLLKGALANSILDGKVCVSFVKKEERKLLSVPKRGYNYSETQKTIASVIGTDFELDDKQLLFLRTHPHVAAITNQNRVFSKGDTSLDLHYYDESCDEKVRSAKDMVKVNPWSSRLRNRPPYKNDAHTKEKEDANAVSVRRIEVPTNKIGLLKGTCGSTLSYISRQSSAYILVDDNHEGPSSPFKSVKIMGTLKQFEKARKLILDLISEVPRSRTSHRLQSGRSDFTSNESGNSQILRCAQPRNGSSKEVTRNPQPSYIKPRGSSHRVEQSLHPPPGYGGGSPIHQGWPGHGVQLPRLNCPPGHGVQLAPLFGPPGHGVQAPPLQGPPGAQPLPLQGWWPGHGVQAPPLQVPPGAQPPPLQGWPPGAQPLPFQGWPGHGVQVPPLRGPPGARLRPCHFKGGGLAMVSRPHHFKFLLALSPHHFKGGLLVLSPCHFKGGLAMVSRSHLFEDLLVLGPCHFKGGLDTGPTAHHYDEFPVNTSIVLIELDYDICIFFHSNIVSSSGYICIP